MLIKNTWQSNVFFIGTWAIATITVKFIYKYLGMIKKNNPKTVPTVKRAVQFWGLAT
jgi:hypothetical protein